MLKYVRKKRLNPTEAEKAADHLEGSYVYDDLLEKQRDNKKSLLANVFFGSFRGKQEESAPTYTLDDKERVEGLIGENSLLKYVIHCLTEDIIDLKELEGVDGIDSGNLLKGLITKYSGSYSEPLTQFKTDIQLKLNDVMEEKAVKEGKSFPQDYKKELGEYRDTLQKLSKPGNLGKMLAPLQRNVA